MTDKELGRLKYDASYSVKGLVIHLGPKSEKNKEKSK